MYSLKNRRSGSIVPNVFQTGSISTRENATSEELQPEPFQLHLETCQTSPMSIVYDTQQMIQIDKLAIAPLYLEKNSKL